VFTKLQNLGRGGNWSGRVGSGSDRLGLVNLTFWKTDRVNLYVDIFFPNFVLTLIGL
jgi:hypothetical protein